MNAIEQRTCHHCATVILSQFRINQAPPLVGGTGLESFGRSAQIDNKYIIQMHGSQRLVLRNRVHLRKVTPLLSPNRALSTPYAGNTAVAAPSSPRRSSSPMVLDRVPIPEAPSPAPSTQHLHALVMCLRMELTVQPSPCLTLLWSIQKPWNDNPKETGNYPMIQADDPPVPTGRPNGTRTTSRDCISFNAQD